MSVKPTSFVEGQWRRLLSNERLRRSSQVVSAIGQTVCVFGGEVQPRQPVDNQIDVFSLTSDSLKLDTKSISPAPSPRVGSASAALNGKMYLFSGRGGTDMAPIEENGAVWSFDPVSSSWSSIQPQDLSKPYPPARSYHCATSDGHNSIFVHAGCPSKGRLSDLWKFNFPDRTWTQLADAPAPQRGGTSIAYSGGKLYRMNGFDGETEQGGSIDIFDLASNSWSTKTYKADGNDGPEPRSVSVLLPVRLGQKGQLITLFGERDPSSLGHAGAGKMLSDAWIYDISENRWIKVHAVGTSGVPDPRGWFDADVVETSSGNDSILVHGGLGENNERLTDIWLLTF